MTGDSMGEARNEAERADREWLRAQLPQPEPHRTIVLWQRWLRTGDRFQANCHTCGWIGKETADKAAAQFAATAHEQAHRQVDCLKELRRRLSPS